MIRVVIADDHDFVRAAVQMLLQQTADIQLVGEAVTGKEAVEHAKQLQPDVIIMDISMPEMDGLAATAAIQSHDHDTGILIISMYSNKSLVDRARAVGARGYLHKQALSEQLLAAVRAIHRGENYFP